MLRWVSSNPNKLARVIPKTLSHRLLADKSNKSGPSNGKNTNNTKDGNNQKANQVQEKPASLPQATNKQNDSKVLSSPQQPEPSQSAVDKQGPEKALQPSSSTPAAKTQYEVSQPAQASQSTQSKTPDLDKTPVSKPPQPKQKIATPFTSIPAPKTKAKREEDNLSFVMNIFKGLIEAKQVFPYPNVLKKEEKEALQHLIDPITKFFQEVNNAEQNESEGKIEEKSLSGLWKLGLFTLQVPKDFGGLGLSYTQYARVLEIIGAYDLGVGITLAAHQSTGISLFGTQEQKAKYLPRISNGEIASFCCTETSSGLDRSSIKTKAELSPDGTFYVLNGSKKWIRNGGLAEIMTVLAQTTVKQPDGVEVNKITAFIVERSFGGVTSGPPENKMGIKCCNITKVSFDNVKVPIENVLGGVGNGFHVAMDILNNGRFGMAAALSGTMKTCIAKSIQFATQREQFHEKIINFGTIQEKIARMAILQYVSESMAYMLPANVDSGYTQYQLEAAISKCFASEAAWFVCDESIQIMGGPGYIKEMGLERIMRDLRVFRIVDGTNELLRLFIALTGIQYAGATLKELQKAFMSPTANLGLIYGIFTKKMVQKVGLHQVNMNNLVHKDLHVSAILLSRKIEDFANRIEILLIKYGKNIVKEQFVLNRLANCAIDMYASAVVLSRATNSLNQNLQSAQIEKAMAQVWTDEACLRVTNHLTTVRSKASLDNFNKFTLISNAIAQNLGVVQKTPLNI